MPRSPEHSQGSGGAYEGILAGLPPRERRIVHEVVASGAIEGYMPDLESIARLADLASGKITGDQYRAEILARLRGSAPDE